MEPPVTWQSLLATSQVRTHKTSQAELHELRGVVERDLKDAKASGISADRRFATAYNAVLQLAKIVIACEGYRVVGLGHHKTAFKALALTMGPQISALAAFFDVCRRKRNQVDYDSANVATESETDDLVAKAEGFQKLVEAWIRQKHPQYGK